MNLVSVSPFLPPVALQGCAEELPLKDTKKSKEHSLSTKGVRLEKFPSWMKTVYAKQYHLRKFAFEVNHDTR